MDENREKVISIIADLLTIIYIIIWFVYISVST